MVYDGAAMSWVKWAGKGLVFAGNLAQTDGFEAWAKSKGEKIIEEVALTTSGFRKEHKAKNLIWSELNSIAKTSREFSDAINDIAAGYPELIGKLASKHEKLPHVDIDLCVVPRLLVQRDARIEVKKQLGKSEELAKLRGGASLRDYFLEELTGQLDVVFSKHAEKLSPEDPLELNYMWIVGFSPNYRWKEEPGHYFVYSNTLRADRNANKQQKKEGRKEASDLLKKCSAWLGKLSQKDRQKWELKFP